MNWFHRLLLGGGSKFGGDGPAEPARPGTCRARRVGPVPGRVVRKTGHMAQRVETVVIDDLDGASPADETIRFAIDGASYEIDLTADHAEELRSHLNTYVG